MHFNFAKAFANVVAGKDAVVWIVRGEDFQAITENSQHANEMLKLLTRLLRNTSKIVRATLRSPGVLAGGASREETRRTIKIMCYDTTSWVREVSNYPFRDMQVLMKIVAKACTTEL